jgi:hypothetical protein
MKYYNFNDYDDNENSDDGIDADNTLHDIADNDIHCHLCQNVIPYLSKTHIFRKRVYCIKCYSTIMQKLPLIESGDIKTMEVLNNARPNRKEGKEGC